MSQKIQILQELEHIRLRPGMYIGDVATPKRLIGELVDNALDECLNGHSTKLVVKTEKLEKNLNKYTVRDYGRGLPTDLIPTGSIRIENGIETPEVDVAAKLLFLKLFSGGKFDKENYEISSGLHGVGLTVVNALSNSVIVTTRTRSMDKAYRIEFSQGIVISETYLDSEFEVGTEISCIPDPHVFTTTKAPIDERALKLAKLELPHVSFELDGVEVTPLKFEEIFPEQMIYSEPFVAEFDSKSVENLPVKYKGTRIRVYFNWVKDQFDVRWAGSVNLLSVNQGQHVKTARSCVTKALSSLIANRQARDFEIGLRLYVASFVPDVGFTSQSKENLSKADALKDLDKRIQQSIHTSIKSCDFGLIEAKILSYLESMNKLSSMELVKQVVKLGSGKVPNRNLGIGMFDCTARDRTDTELFIVEGDSAAGGLVKERDRKSQAILPLKGKVLNVSASNDFKRILKNKELKALINCIGVGLRDLEDTDRRRYDRIIIFSDADPDGQQIASLLIGAFGYLFPKLLKEGYVYMLKNPLYSQGGKFIYEEKDLNRKKPFDRFKGLGELDPDQLAEIALNKDKRTLIQLKIEEDYEVEDIINLVANPGPKKELMETHGLI